MTEPGARGQESPSRRLEGPPVPCATCGVPVDPLRAARVAVFGERFHYFCSASCRERYVPKGRPPPRRSATATPRSEPGEHDEIVRAARAAAQRQSADALAEVEGDALSRISSRRAGADPAAAGDTPSEAPPPKLVEDVVGPTDVGSLLLAIALVSSTLAVALSLVGSTPAALTARVVLVIIASGSFVVHTLTPGRDPSEPHPIGLALAPLGAGAVALIARILGHPEAGPSTNVAGVLVGTLAAGVWLVQRARKPVDTERDHIAESLACGGHRVVGEEIAEASSHDLRPGEEIVLDQGEVVPVDATVVAGTAKVLPWLGAKTAATRGEGDALVAGAYVLEGRLRAIVGWAGTDRAWMRLTSDPRRRADIHASLARLGRHLAERGSVILAGIAALAAFSSDRDLLVIAEFAVVAHASLANAPVALVAALHVAHTVFAALRRGIAFRTAEAFDRAGRASAAVFCARGTLLLGEPEVASIDPIGPHTAEMVLSLLAGAESGSSQPTAIAIQRAARARGVRADGVRSPTVLPGLGVTAVASTGQPLVVGSRGLMLKERISVALAESRIVDLEAMGRSVILVALGGKLVGAVGLQDGLRPGARAAVQHLLDVGVEPILLSGDARETCDALGRAVDIEHIRPEVLPGERGEEIRRLADGGAVVAVLGQSPVDDAALSAADVSVALNSAGASSAEWHVQLASDDVRDAAFSLRLAHTCRWRARASLTIAAAPGVMAATLMAIGVAPPAVVPLAALAGGVAAVFRLRARG